MNKPEEKKIYRIIAQKKGITITAETTEVTMEEATEGVIANLLGGIDKSVEFQPFIAVPVTTQERWNARYINFCPRCGANISEYELEEYANTDCYECDVSLDIQILYHDSGDED